MGELRDKVANFDDFFRPLRNYFYWEPRKPGMRDALRELARERRDELVIAIQSYHRFGFGLRRAVEKALRDLRIDQADILFLGWFNRMPSGRLMEAASRLREEGRVRFLGFSGHTGAWRVVRRNQTG